MQIAKSKGSSKLAGSCEVKHHVLVAIQRVAMPGSTKNRQGQVRYPLQLTRRNRCLNSNPANSKNTSTRIIKCFETASHLGSSRDVSFK